MSPGVVGPALLVLAVALVVTLRGYGSAPVFPASDPDVAPHAPAAEAVEATPPAPQRVLVGPAAPPPASARAGPLIVEVLGPDGPIRSGVTVAGPGWALAGPTADGRWSLAHSGQKTYGVTFVAAGYLDRYVSALELQDAALRVELAPEVRLHVVLEGARPVDGWWAEVRFDLTTIPANRFVRGNYPPQQAPGEPDADERARYAEHRGRGTWTLDLAPEGLRSLGMIPQGGEVEVEFFHFGQSRATLQILLPQAGEARAAHQPIGRERMLVCTVVDARDQPVAGAEVQVAPRRQGPAPDFSYGERTLEDWLAPRFRTDAAGVVAVPLPDAADDVLRVRKPGLADTVLTIDRVLRERGRIVLAVGRTVVLTVVDAEGEMFYGGHSNGYGAYYSKPWVHLGEGLWRAGSWPEEARGPGAEALTRYRDWVFADLPPGIATFRIESVGDFEFHHDTSGPTGRCTAPIRAEDIPYGK